MAEHEKHVTGGALKREDGKSSAPTQEPSTHSSISQHSVTEKSEDSSSTQQETNSAHTAPITAEAKPRVAAQSDESDDEDGNEVLEESPCGRWVKRREQVKQRDVPGIDVAYLAMDTETGNEVVWNEVQFSERKNYRSQEENIRAIFDNLTQLSHCNLVRFYKYWTDDAKAEKPRVIFITEYMSSGNMSQFLKRTRKGNKTMNLKAWRKWCTQILSALSYLHSSDPAIVHGNLSCNTIFIQQNGLIKIGCVAPNAIHHHVKTFRENLKNMHYIPPEFEQTTKGTRVTTASDIYSFGVCALEMAVLGFATNGDSEPKAPQVVTQDMVQKKLQSLTDARQQDFIQSCLRKNPEDRPTANQLLFHAVLFEVHSLKLLAAHRIADGKLFETLPEDTLRIIPDKDRVIAEINHPSGESNRFTYAQVPQADLDKFLEDVRNGIYPLTAFAKEVQPPTVSQGVNHRNQGTRGGSVNGSDRAKSPAEPSGGPGEVNGQGDRTKGGEAEKEEEHRSVIKISVDILLKEPKPEEAPCWTITILLKMEDMMNRKLTTDIGENDTPEILARELSQWGLIREEDWPSLAQHLEGPLINKPMPRTPRSSQPQAAAAAPQATTIVGS